MDGWMNVWNPGKAALNGLNGVGLWVPPSGEWIFFFPKKPFLNGELRRLLCIKILIFGMLISTISK